MIQLDLELRQGDFDLAIRADLGDSVALLGPSGAGKTTVLEAVAGLRRARGRVAIDGEVLQDSATGLFLPPERRRLGYVPQDGALFPHLSVMRNLTFGSTSRSGARRNGADLTAIVELLDLGSLLSRYPRHLSGGERHRVALGRALLAQPRLLLLDEPTARLDPLRARKALALILRLRREFAVPLLLVTHRRDEALALAAEVVLLEGGQALAVGKPEPALLGRAALASPWAGRWPNVLSATVVSHDRTAGITEVHLKSGEAVSIPLHLDLAVGSDTVLAIDAEDLLIATSPPAGISARNAIVGRVETLLAAGPSVYARVGPWLAHLTPAAVAELGLACELKVWLIAKSYSWRVLAG